MSKSLALDVFIANEVGNLYSTIIPESVERLLGGVKGRGRISRSGLTQDIKMGSCVFQCDVPH